MIGFALGSLGEVQFSWVGLVYGVLSSVFVALYSIYVKIAAPEVNNDTW
jgi:GDP-fucose transporter C1